MPTYEYRCPSCGYDFEIFQKFSDKPLSVCPQCGGELRKVFNSVGIVFKGSGFYSTDNHSAGQHKSAAPASPAEHSATDSSAGKAPSSSDGHKADAGQTAPAQSKPAPAGTTGPATSTTAG